MQFLIEILENASFKPNFELIEVKFSPKVQLLNILVTSYESGVKYKFPAFLGLKIQLLNSNRP